RIATWERQVELTARALVDASGDAVVAHLAGVATVTAPLAERQLPSLVFVLQHVDREALGPGPRVALLRLLMAAEQEGRLPKGAANLALAPSPQPGEVVCKLTLSGTTEELPASRDFLTVAEQEGRKRAFAVTEFLKTLPAFSRAFVSHAAPQVGVRESRRVSGRYQLTREDVLSGRKFEDGIGRAAAPTQSSDRRAVGPLPQLRAARARGAASRRVSQDPRCGARSADRAPGAERSRICACRLRPPGLGRVPGPARQQSHAHRDRRDRPRCPAERLPRLAQGRRPRGRALRGRAGRRV